MAKDQRQINSASPEDEKRFRDLQELSTIGLAAPHQNILQNLIAERVAEETRGLMVSEKPVEILEIGTGEGLTARRILGLSDSVRVISVDNDEGMVARARKNLEHYIERGRLEIRCEGALEFLKSFSDNSIFIIASGFTIHNFKNEYRQKVLEEVFRVLRAGGKFITGDKIMPNDKEVLEREVAWQSAQLDNIPDLAERNKWLDHYKEDMASDTIMYEKDIINVMKQIGFRSVKVSDRYHLDALLVTKK